MSAFVALNSVNIFAIPLAQSRADTKERYLSVRLQSATCEIAYLGFAAHSRSGGGVAFVSPATRTNSIDCVRPMGYRNGKSPSTAGKELRRMGSALFGNNLDRFR